LFRQILEQQLEKAGEDPILFEQVTERSANSFAVSLTHRLFFKINEEIKNHFRGGYATMTANIIAEDLSVAASRFLGEFGLKKSLPFAKEF
jgi:hypothetical protein